MISDVVDLWWFSHSLSSQLNNTFLPLSFLFHSISSQLNIINFLPISFYFFSFPFFSFLPISFLLTNHNLREFYICHTTTTNSNVHSHAQTCKIAVYSTICSLVFQNHHKEKIVNDHYHIVSPYDLHIGESDENRCSHHPGSCLLQSPTCTHARSTSSKITFHILASPINYSAATRLWENWM